MAQANGENGGPSEEDLLAPFEPWERKELRLLLAEQRFRKKLWTFVRKVLAWGAAVITFWAAGGKEFILAVVKVFMTAS